MRKISRNRKGIEVWISWVLLMGFVVLLSTMMYDFIRDYTKDTAEDLKRVASNTEECNLAAISIDSICRQTAVSPIYLNMTVTNRLNTNIDQIMFRVFDANDQFLNISSLNLSTETLTLRPQQSMKITLNISDSTANTVQAIPVILKGDTTIICRNKMVEKTGIGDC